jgi:hypothetical protein
MRKQSNTKQPRNRHPSPGEARPRLHSGARVHTEGRAVARASPRRGYVTRKRTLKLQRKKTSIGTSSYSRRVASRRVVGVCVLDGWMDVPTRTHSWMLLLMFSSVWWTRPMGYLTVYEGSIRARNGMYRGSSSIHPSFHPSVVSSNACAQKRASAPRVGPSARTRASMDRSIYFRCIGFRRRRSRASVASVASDA